MSNKRSRTSHNGHMTRTFVPGDTLLDTFWSNDVTLACRKSHWM